MPKKKNASGSAEARPRVRDAVKENIAPDTGIRQPESVSPNGGGCLHRLMGDSIGFLAVWTLPDKRTRWYRCPDDLDRAECESLDLATGHDVFFGVALHGPDEHPEKGRGTAETASTLRVVWADLDVEDPAHLNGHRLFQTKSSALAFLRERVPLAPSLVVDSGHGVHTYWILEESLDLTDPNERQDAEALVISFQAYLRQQAGEYHIDTTHDLTRVLRVPGTINRKREPYQAVSVIDDLSTWRVYNPSDFFELAPRVEPRPPEQQRIASLDVPFVLRDHAEPPGSKMPALLENERNAQLTWERKRNDLNDQTPSGYCQALADHAAAVGWTFQEIVDLLVAWRRRHCPTKLKTDRPDWYRRTVGKAIQLHRRQAERAAAIDTTEDVARGADVKRSELLGALSEILGLRFLSVTRYAYRDPTGYTGRSSYVLDLLDRSKNPVKVDIGMRTLLRPIEFAEKVGNATNLMPETVPQGEWRRRVAGVLQAAAVEMEAPPESNPHHLMRSRLAAFISEGLGGPLSDPFEAADADVLYEDENGALWFPWSCFVEWWSRERWRSGVENLAPGKMATRLKAIGCVSRQHDDRGQRSNRRRRTAVLWRVPDDLTGGRPGSAL